MQTLNKKNKLKMKKFFIIMALSIFAFTMNAQNETAVKTSKFFDDWYVGINGGPNVKTTHTVITANLSPSWGIRIGKNVTPVIGFAVEGTAFNQVQPYTVENSKDINVSNVSLIGTFNASNFLFGYNGEPRVFEIVGIAGFGWMHTFNNINEHRTDFSIFKAIQSYPSLYASGVGIQTVIPNNSNILTSKLGFDLDINAGQSKQLQVFIEPSITYALNPNSKNIKFNVNNSFISINVGLIYKFKNSHGTHNFVVGRILDENAWYDMNTELNNLRSTNTNLSNTVDTQAKVIKDLTEQTNKVKNDERIDIGNAIGFKINSSKVDKLQMSNLDLIAKTLQTNKNKKITVVGYADKETGTPAYNQKLSIERANAVKRILVALGADERQVITKGNGSEQTVFNQNEWNRAAIFINE